jgi:sulfate transport system ATP-binding protein
MSVRVVGITKHFGRRREVVGVRDVSFEAPAHRVTSLLGPSGSGKSTLLRMVAGLEVPDAGQVLIDGEDVTKVAVRRRNVGFVFQNYALFSHMSVFDNIAFGLSVQRAPKAATEERVQELLALVQLQGYERRLPHELSGGQRQRIALARALAPRPRVLLLDEPFGALDTQLLVTHDQEEALELSEHVVVLRDGEVEQAGAPGELYEHPANAFVASFLGGARLLTGKVESGRVSFTQQALTATVDLAEGSLVQALVRPQDVRVRKARQEDRPELCAKVERLTKVGSYVKLNVHLPDGESFVVQMQRYELDERGIEPGDRVVLDLRAEQVRPPSASSYAI